LLKLSVHNVSLRNTSYGNVYVNLNTNILKKMIVLPTLP